MFDSAHIEHRPVLHTAVRWLLGSRAGDVFTDQTTAVGSFHFMLVPGRRYQALCSVRFLSLKHTHTVSDARPARTIPHKSQEEVT